MADAMKTARHTTHVPRSANRFMAFIGAMRPAMRKMECPPIYKVRTDKTIKLIEAIQ